jgi:DNA modification methylase
MIITETIFKKLPGEFKVCFNKLPNPSSDEVRECFPDTNPSKRCLMKGGKQNTIAYGDYGEILTERGHNDNGGNASRFFKSIIYQAKASKSERNNGMDDIEEKEWKQENSPNPNREERPFLPVKNNHPTVKPIALMEYLIKMVTKE